MKIAYLGVKGIPSKSGTERVVEAIITRLRDRHEITVYCDKRYTPHGTVFEKVNLVLLPTIKGRHLRAITLGILSALHAVLLGKYDIIHLNGVENSFLLPLLRIRFPVITTSHGTPGRIPPSKWNKFEHLLMQLMEYPFLFLSNYPTVITALDSAYILERYKRNVTYIPNGVDVDVPINYLGAQTLLNNIGVQPYQYLLFVAGRIIPRKGCHLILEAMHAFNISNPLIIVGDLGQSPEYGAKIKELTKGLSVYFLPPIIDKGILFGLIKQSNIFIFPSTAEGMSIMFLEVASLGVPMISSDIEENKLVLGEDATYFHNNQPEDLGKQIIWTLEHHEEIKVKSSRSQARVNNHFSWDTIAIQYERLYQSCNHRTKSNG